MHFVDLTHTFTPDMPVYPGDPKANLEQVAWISKETYNDFKIETLMHVGTHMDGPFHMLKEGKTLDQLSPNHFFAPGLLIDARGKKVIDSDLLPKQLSAGLAVLIFTDRSKHYHTPKYFEDLPFLTEKFAQTLVKARTLLVGMDFLGPDLDNPWPAHKILLGKQILILENLNNLESLNQIEKFEVIALPAKFQSDSAPVRVIARY